MFHSQHSFGYAYCQRIPKSVTWSVLGVTCQACLRALGFYDAKPYPKERP